MTRRIHVHCRAHGLLRQHGHLWECAGWDGEGCSTVPYGMTDAAVMRLLTGETYWPGVTVWS